MGCPGAGAGRGGAAGAGLGAAAEAGGAGGAGFAAGRGCGSGFCRRQRQRSGVLVAQAPTHCRGMRCGNLRCNRGSRFHGHRRRWSGRRSWGLFNRRLGGFLCCDRAGSFRIGSALQCFREPFRRHRRGSNWSASFFSVTPKPAQKVDNCLGLDLQLSGQFVNSNLG